MSRITEYQSIVLQFNDGTIGIMAFVTKEYNPSGDVTMEVEPTDENIKYEITHASFPVEKNGVKGYTLISQDEVPTDRTYRDAWQHNPDDGFHHDMDRAKELHKEILRQERTPLLDHLDKLYFKADENGDISSKEKIAARKKELRDITDHPDISAATTIDELKTAAFDVLDQ